MVARALLGKVLVRGERAGAIVETEAYVGSHDLACHARFGRTKRTEIMFGEPGTAYVYLCYGIHDLFNVVTGSRGSPEAVLIRALEPLAGLDPAPATARGPGKLTRALGITRADNGLDLVLAPDLIVRTGRRVRPDRIASGPRVGVDYAGAWADAPLRYWIEGSAAVSRRARSRPRRRALAERSP